MASAIRLGHRTSSLVRGMAHNAWEVPAYALSCSRHLLRPPAAACLTTDARAVVQQVALADRGH